MVENYDMELLGKKVKELRKKKGYTIEKLAEVVDISTSHIKNIEGANSNISLQLAFNLARALDVTMNDLFYDEQTLDERRMARLLMYKDKFDKYSDETFDIITDSVIDLLDKNKKEKDGNN